MKKFILAIPSGTLSLAITLFIAYISLDSNPLDINSIRLFPGADKCIHFIMYFGCATVYLYEYAKHKLPHHTNLNVQLAITTFAALLGMMFEIAQLLFTENRTFDTLDCVANATGAFCGFLIMHFWGMSLVHRSLYKTVVKHRHHHRHHHTHSEGR